jgi:tetratricopeptide (TPR) repeat protein
MPRLVMAISLALVALALPTLAVAQAGPGAGAAKQGRDLQRKGQHADAIQKFQEAIAAERNNYRYHVYKGDSEGKLKKYSDAIASYRAATALNKEDPRLYVKLGMAFAKAKQYPGAVQAFNSAYDYEKDASKKLQYKLFAVKLLTRQNQPQQAMAELNKLKPTNSNDPRVLAAEGDIYGAMNQWPAAVASHEKALAAIPATSPTREKQVYNLALAYHKSGNTAKGKELAATLSARYQALYKRAAGASAASGDVRIARGYLRANQLEEAQQFAKQAIDKEPNSPLGYQTMATVLIRRGQNQPAIGLLRKAAELEKDEAKRAKIQSSMLKVQFNAGDYRGALESANAILAKSPTNATVLGLKAQSEYQLGQFANAIATTEKAVAAANKDPQKSSAFFFTQGLAAKKAGDLERAKTAFKEAEKSSTFRYAARNEAAKIAAR